MPIQALLRSERLAYGKYSRESSVDLGRGIMVDCVLREGPI